MLFYVIVRSPLLKVDGWSGIGCRVKSGDELCEAGVSDETGVPSSTVVATSSRVPVCSRCVSMSGIWEATGFNERLSWYCCQVVAGCLKRFIKDNIIRDQNLSRTRAKNEVTFLIRGETNEHASCSAFSLFSSRRLFSYPTFDYHRGTEDPKGC